MRTHKERQANCSNYRKADQTNRGERVVFAVGNAHNPVWEFQHRFNLALVDQEHLGTGSWLDQIGSLNHAFSMHSSGDFPIS